MKPSSPGLSLVGRFLITASNSSQLTGLFRLFTWSWFNFGMWYLSKKNVHFFYIFQFCDIQAFVVRSNDSLIFLCVCGYVPLFISDLINLCVLFLPFDYFGEGFVNLVDFLQEPAFCFIDSLDCFLCFYFVDFSPQFDYFQSSTPPG